MLRSGGRDMSAGSFPKGKTQTPITAVTPERGQMTTAQGIHRKADHHYSTTVYPVELEFPHTAPVVESFGKFRPIKPKSEVHAPPWLHYTGPACPVEAETVALRTTTKPKPRLVPLRYGKGTWKRGKLEQVRLCSPLGMDEEATATLAGP